MTTAADSVATPLKKTALNATASAKHITKYLIKINIASARTCKIMEVLSAKHTIAMLVILSAFCLIA